MKLPPNETIPCDTRDLAGHKQAEARLRKLNRVYAVLSDINQAIVRLREPPALFEQVCRIAVQVGGFRMAWIGLVDESSQQMRVVAHAGGADTYFEQAGVTLRDALVDDCPIQNALRSGQRAICNMIRRAAPCQEIAFQLGSRSSAAFPLRVSGKIRGTVSFYSGEPDFFDEDEIQLLDELALDVSFSMEFAEKEAERKRAEKAIGSLARFPSENPNPVMRIQRDGILLYANEASDALLRDWQLEIGQPAPPVLREAVSDALTRQMGITIDTQHDQRIISFFVAPVVEAGYANLYGRDVTDRRRAEEALRESEELFRAFFENAVEAMFLTMPDGRIIAANPAACQMFGRTEQEMIEGGQEAVVDVTDPRLGILLKERLEKGKAHGELAYLRRDGTKFQGEITSALYRDRDGNQKTSMIIRDVTERKRAEEELKKSEVKFRAIFDNASDGMFIVDLKARKFFMCNAACAKMLGYAQDEFSNLDIADIHLGEDMPFIYEQIGKFSRGEEGIRSDIRFKRKNGSVFESDLSPALLTIGEKKYLLIGFKDITERKRAEGQLAEQLDELRRWHAVTLGRETRILDLKREVNELLAQAGQPPRYASAESENQKEK